MTPARRGPDVSRIDRCFRQQRPALSLLALSLASPKVAIDKRWSKRDNVIQSPSPTVHLSDFTIETAAKAVSYASKVVNHAVRLLLATYTRGCSISDAKIEQGTRKRPSLIKTRSVTITFAPA